MKGFLTGIFAGLLWAAAAHAGAATWRVSPDPCPAPAAAVPYAPEAWVVSPDARDGVRPGHGGAPEYWPPAALTIPIPSGATAAGRVFAWFDGAAFALPVSAYGEPGCEAADAAPQ